MKIEEEVTDKIKFYFLSEHRKFKGLVKIVSHYKHEDLKENFIYDATLMLVYHCHKPVFTPKMAIFWRAGIREGGLPLPLAFQYLILLI